MKVVRAEDLRRKRVCPYLGFAHFFFFRELRRIVEVSMLQKVHKLLAFLQMLFAMLLDLNSGCGFGRVQFLHQCKIFQLCY